MLDDGSHVGVIIPALNEEGALGEVISQIPTVVDTIVVVDNGSTDNTIEVAKQAGTIVLTEAERGYGAACLTGIDYLKDKVEIIAFVDGDNSDFPAEINLLLEKISDGYDFALGSRMIKKESRSALTFQARFGNRLAPFLIRLRYGFRYTDLGPMRAIRTKSLLSLEMLDRNYGWTVEMQIKALQQKLKIAEIPVSYRNRLAGKSKVSGSLRGTIGASWKIIYTIIKYA